MKHTIWKAIVFLLITPAFYNCKNLTNAQKGVLIGAGVGGAAGGIVGNAQGNTALGAILGATIGGLAGGLIGKKMDQQAAEIEKKIPGAEVKRVGEGINVTFESGVLFSYDKSNLTNDASGKIAELAKVLNQYPDTYVLVEGHTDAKGTDTYNMGLSSNRAASVVQELTNNNISQSRIKTASYGEKQPKVPNDTEQNRAKNRRVEFAIYANEKMINEAKEESKKGS